MFVLLIEGGVGAELNIDVGGYKEADVAEVG